MAVRSVTGTMPGLAAMVSIVSLSFAAGMIVQILVLLFRRRRIEKRAAISHATERAVSREVMALISGQLTFEDAAVFAAASPADRLQALSHLMQLVRGDDRDALLAIADRSHILDGALKGIRRRSAARRVDAMRVLEQFATPESVEALTLALSEDPAISVRIEAAAALARMGRPQAPAALIHLLDLRHQPPTRLHEALFRAAAEPFAPDLVRLADDRSLGGIRPLLVEALGWSGNFAVADGLGAHAADADPDVRCAALRAARRLGNPAAAPWALRLLLDPVESVRIQAIQACERLGVRDAIPILTSLIENPSWWVRMRAKQALDSLRPRQAIRVDVTGMSQ
jgi:HEAT repeat protein